jgi:hypothetical protein
VCFLREEEEERGTKRRRERERLVSTFFKGLEIEPRYVTIVINKILKKPLVF